MKVFANEQCLLCQYIVNSFLLTICHLRRLTYVLIGFFLALSLSSRIMGGVSFSKVR